MRVFTAVIEKCPTTGLYVGTIPGLPGGHTQAPSLDELHENLKEVLKLLSEEGELRFESEFIGTRTIQISSP